MVGASLPAQEAAEAEQTRLQKAPQHSGRLLVRMPATLHDELAQAAEREGVSLNQYITGVLAGSVEWAGDEGAHARGRWSRLAPARVTWIALIANFAVVLLAAIAAITLLVVAWQS